MHKVINDYILDDLGPLGVYKNPPREIYYVLLTTEISMHDGG